ncbi:Uncharacterised protein [Vibrio cholerae]|nr:Uncharacterised protein [Vibrio cholerae]CSI85576.1 Uncharacterised protein [Vibrio cholerae]
MPACLLCHVAGISLRKPSVAASSFSQLARVKSGSQQGERITCCQCSSQFLRVCAPRITAA